MTMRKFFFLIGMASMLVVGTPIVSAVAEEAPGGAASPANAEATCEHGVAQRLCARCNPKLAAVYKAKGDWCQEHSRPESQCVICHPDLAKKGIK